MKKIRFQTKIDSRYVDNQSIIQEEERGSARELIPRRLSTLSDSVQNEIHKLSVLEVIQ